MAETGAEDHELTRTHVRRSLNLQIDREISLLGGYLLRQWFYRWYVLGQRIKVFLGHNSDRSCLRSTCLSLFTFCNAPFLRQNAIIPNLTTSDNLPRNATNQTWLPLEMHWKLVSSKARIASDFSTLLRVKQGEKRKRCHSEIRFPTFTSDVVLNQNPNKQTSHE